MTSLKILLFFFCVSISQGSDLSLEKRSFSEDPCLDRSLKIYTNILIGERVFLRPTFPSDYTSIVPIFSDPSSMKYVGEGRIFSKDEVKEFVVRWAFNNNQPQTDRFNWSILTRDGIVGRLAFFANNEKEPIEEIAYALNPSFHGRGIGTDAVRLAINSKEGAILATVHPKNIPSRELLKKLGFQADLSRVNVPKYGSFRDYYLLPAKD